MPASSTACCSRQVSTRLLLLCRPTPLRAATYSTYTAAAVAASAATRRAAPAQLPRRGVSRCPVAATSSRLNTLPRRGYAGSSRRSLEPREGTVADVHVTEHPSASRFYFEAGYALFAKRPSKPFPPPFLSAPSSSFSDPLSTHNRSRDRRQYTREGDIIRGVTNGDDAVLVTENLIAANDGVGAWAQKERGHAALWSRLILHFWSVEAEQDRYGVESEPDVKAYLSRAFETTKTATSKPNEWYGTTTVSGALMHQTSDGERPLLYVAQLGDSQILVVRPKYQEVLFKTEEQWHWFDCPRQLGTNSPDTPEENAVISKVELEEGDVVLAMSDGVADNLWEHEIVETVSESIRKAGFSEDTPQAEVAAGMKMVARELAQAAMTIAQDPFAESPFMERAIEEGLPTEGGKLDDISVVAAICTRRRAS